MPPTVSVILAGSASVPLSRPPATASRTAFSISRWEVTPTVLRNRRMLVLSTSSFMRFSCLEGQTRIYEPRSRSLSLMRGDFFAPDKAGTARSMPVFRHRTDGVEHRGAAFFQGLANGGLLADLPHLALPGR